MMKRQINWQNTFQAILNEMDDNTGLWSSNSAMSTVVASLTNYMQLLTDAATNQIKTTKGITQSKMQTRAVLIQLALQHSAACMGYAASIDNTELKISSKILYSTLNRAADVMLVDICQALYNRVNPYAASLSDFGADATTLSTFQNAITNYMPVGVQPKVAIAYRRTATINVKTQIAVLKTLVKEQLDMLMLQYKTTEPDFYNEYMNLRHPAHSNHRRKTVDIKIQVEDANNNPLPNAEITLTSTKGTTRHKLSNAKGTQHFERLKPDMFTINVSLPNYVTQTQSISTLAPQTLSVVFVMEEGSQ